MNPRANRSARFGAGLNRRCAIAALLLLGAPPLPVAAEIEHGAWIEAEAWPYSHAVENTGADPVLIVIEQAGIDLRLRLGDRAVSNGPIGRMGPEFVFLPAGEAAQIELEPLYPATGRGRFRFTRVPLDDDALTRAGRILSEAGRLFGSAGQAARVRACEQYGRVSSLSGLGAEWLDLAELLTVSCYFGTGREIPPARLEALNEELAFLSVLPYHAHWLRAEALYVALSYDRVDAEIGTALSKAAAALDAFPEREPGIRHDLAEMRAVLGGNAAILAFVVGRDDSNDGLNEKERLLERSEAHLSAAIAEARALDNAYVLGRAYDFRAGMHFVKGDDLRIIDDLMLAKEQIEKTSNPDFLLPILGSIGDFHKRWGELRAAQEAYLETLRIVDGNTSNGKYADVYHNIGIFYYDLGDFARARSFFETSTRLSRETGRERRAYTNSRQLALVLEAEGDLRAARALNEELLGHFAGLDAASGAQSWSPFRIMTQAALSRIDYKLGDLAEALRLSSEVVEQIESRAINVSTDLPAIYINHANVLFANGDRGGALEILDDMIERHDSQPIEMVDLLAAKMNLLQRLGSTADAVAVANRVFGIIESQRMEFDTVRLGPYWSGRTNEIYTSHVDYLLQIEGDRARHQARAFAVTERARATSLRLRRQEMLRIRNETNSRARAEWIETVSEIQEMQGQLRTEQDQLDFERRISEARERYFAAHGLSADIDDLEVRSLEETQEHLSGEAALAQFVAGPEKVWRFDVTAEAWSVTEIGETSAVQTLIDAALSELSDASNRGREHTEALSSVLLGDLRIDVSRTNLLVSPSYSLNRFPFSALRLGGEYLSDLAPITLVPSVSEYFAARPEPTAADGDAQRLEIAVLADPAFGDLETPVPTASESFRGWAESLQRLPASALEATELSRFYPEDSRLILLGPDATQKNFFDKRVRDAKVIHIATHGYFNEAIPDLIGFAMAKDSDDGFVSMAEISAQDFGADLVVISACNTGRGFEIAGEGNMSLARTFLAQGVDSVVSTLWPVSDSATALFMQEFYRALKEERMGLAEALQSAQLALKKTRRYADPFFWSAYVLTAAESPPGVD